MPPMPSTAADQLLPSRLAAGAGVTPGPAWLAACRSHLASLDKENGGGQGRPAASAAEEDADAVLRQILCSDLRDVVRRCRSEDGGDGDGDAGDGNHPGRILRQAILASLGPGSNNHTVTPPPPGNGNNGGHTNTSTTGACVTTLPPGFRLLIQAEECTDVARGAEGRLQQQGGVNNAGNNNGPQHQRGGGGGKRLLKIVGSDGYYGHGLATPPPTSNGEQQQQQQMQQHSIVLMETSPLPSLSAASPAGIKLLLHSSSAATGGQGQHPHPITVRRGIVQINPSNCTVLGGHVPHLLATQRAARERAQRRAGVGVDATVRALVGVDGDDGAEGGEEGGEADDEGEGASGDVVAPPPPPQQQRQQVQNQYQYQQQRQPQQQETQNQYQSNRPNQQQQQRRREAQMEWTPSPPPPPLPPAAGGNPYHRQSNGGAVARPTPSATSLSNPYAASNGGGSGSGGVGATAAAANPYATSGRAASNPYLPSGSVTSSASASAAGTGSSTAHGTISGWVASSKTPAAASKVPAGGGSGGGVVDLCSPEGSAAAAPGGGRPSSSTSSAALSSAHAAASGGSSNNMDVDNNGTDGPFAPFHGSQDSASTAPALAGGGAGGDASGFGKATPASTSTGTSGLASSSGASTPGGAALGLPASSGAYTEPMSFSELRSLLLRIKSDRSAYEWYQDKTFIVPCKLSKTLFDFRFEKVRSGKKDKSGSGSKGEKKKSREYEFCLTAHLTGTVRDGDAKISARFASRIIEPFYSVRPTDLRKMHKEDRERANKLASEGSTQVISEFGDLTSLHMKLLLSAKDYYAQSSLPDTIDGSTPLVIVTDVGR